MRKTIRKYKTIDNEHNFWPSFADVMAALVLVMFFLMLLTFIQNILTGDSLKIAKKELEDTKTNLDKAATDLVNAQYEISLAEDALLILQDDIAAKEKALSLSEALIDEQNEIISLTNKSLDNIRLQLQGIAFLRMDILQKVQIAIQNSLNNNQTTKDTEVSIGDNANIIIGGSFLFEYNSAKINDNAKPVLDQLAASFYDVLSDVEIKDKIDVIIISGHTDDIGNNAYNWELSTNRAQAVVNYLFSASPTLEIEYGEYFAAAGYGENRPIAANDTTENRALNRRIEISIGIKDSAITDMINEYLDDDALTVTTGGQ